MKANENIERTMYGIVDKLLVGLYLEIQALKVDITQKVHIGISWYVM